MELRDSETSVGERKSAVRKLRKIKDFRVISEYHEYLALYQFVSCFELHAPPFNLSIRLKSLFFLILILIPSRWYFKTRQKDKNFQSPIVEGRWRLTLKVAVFSSQLSLSSPRSQQLLLIIILANDGGLTARGASGRKITSSSSRQFSPFSNDGSRLKGATKFFDFLHFSLARLNALGLVEDLIFSSLNWLIYYCLFTIIFRYYSYYYFCYWYPIIDYFVS